jgi:hypothetical protein
MEKVFRVKTDYGWKEFKESEEKEANVFEANLKLQKAKAETEKKEKEQTIKILGKKIEQHIDELNAIIEVYEKETGGKIEFTLINGKLSINHFSSYISDGIDQFVKDMRKYMRKY